MGQTSKGDRQRIWYSHDPEGGTKLHNSAEEAETAAHEDLAYYRDCATADFWHEDMDVLSWGEMVTHGEARRIERTEPTEEQPDGTEEWALVRVSVDAQPAVECSAATEEER